MIIEILSQGEIYQEMKDFIIANQDKITDLNSGSALDTQLKAFATQINQGLVKASGGFKPQFEQIPFQAFKFQREPDDRASGTVVFSRQVADPSQIDIPEGTVVATSSGLLYTTQETVSILAGNTASGAANCVANEPGDAYNVLVGIINVLNTSVDGVNSVTNNTAAAGGRNEESNSSYFARFTNFILGLAGSNDYGVWTASVTVESIQSAFVESHFPPASGLYNFTIYVDDGSGNVPQSKLDEIKLKIRGNNTAEFQGYAAAGINFRVFTAGLVPVNVVYEITIDPATTNATATTTSVNTAITNYINSLWVGIPVIWTEVNRIVKGINGVLDVPILTLNGLSSNVAINSSQVARVSSIAADIT